MSQKQVLTAAQIENLEQKRFVHPFNSNAIRHTRSLGDLTGLTTIGIHLVRVEPGDETTQHHNHEFSDEFVYIVSGTCTLYVDDQIVQLGSGDFAGFPKKGPAHSMKNTGDSDLIYLMGGGRPRFDVGNYPYIKKRMYVIDGQREVWDTDKIEIIRT